MKIKDIIFKKKKCEKEAHLVGDLFGGFKCTNCGAKFTCYNVGTIIGCWKYCPYCGRPFL